MPQESCAGRHAQLAMIGVVASAGLFYLTFPNFIFFQGCWPLGWVFAVPLWFALDQSSLKRRLLYGGCFGLAAHLATLHWFIPYSVPGYGLLVSVLTLQPLVFSVMFPRRYSCLRFPSLYCAAAWVVTEMLRTYVMFGESWSLAHSQAFNLPAVQIVSITGSCGLGFAMMFVNGMVYEAIRYRRRYALPVAALVVGGVMGAGYLMLSSPPEPAVTREAVRIMALQPQISFRDRLDPQKVEEILQRQVTLSRRSLQTNKDHVDLLVWPETSVPDDVVHNAELREPLQALTREFGVPLLLGSAVTQKGRLFNSAVLWSSTGRLQQTYYKQHLVPFSEYVGEGDGARRLEELLRIRSHHFQPGTRPGIFRLKTKDAEHVFGVAICSEDNVAGLFRAYARAGAEFVVVLLNDGWFADPVGLVMHAQHSILRAVENRLPVVRVTNSGWSFSVDAMGRLEPRDPSTITPVRVFIHYVELFADRSLYARWGDVFCGLCGFIVVLHWLYSLRRRQSRISQNQR